MTSTLGSSMKKIIQKIARNIIRKGSIKSLSNIQTAEENIKEDDLK